MIVDAAKRDGNVDAWSSKSFTIDMEEALSRFREDYITILGSNARDLTPQEVYDVVTEIHKAQIKAFKFLGKVLEKHWTDIKNKSSKCGSHKEAKDKKNEKKEGDKDGEKKKSGRDEEISDDDYTNQLAEEIFKVCVETLGEVKIYFKDGSFNLLNKEVIENYSTVELERVISLMTGKDAFTKMRRVELARKLKERDERHAREKDEREANAIKKANEIDMFEKRSNELKVKGLSRVSSDGVFLNIKTHRFLRYKIKYLDSCSVNEWLKLMEALRGTEIIEELECLVKLKDLIREQQGFEKFS
ncbi:hypothetical protein AgCh_024003 [Apium graveolens]